MSLSAKDFQVGDRVMAEDGGEVLMGVIVESLPLHLENDDVCVQWSDEEYVDGFTSHLVPASLLRIWPQRAHDARIQHLLHGNGHED